MNVALIIFAVLGMIAVALLLVLLILNLVARILRRLEPKWYSKKGEVNPIDIAAVASRFAASETGLARFRIAGWQIVINPPVPRSKAQKTRDIERAVGKGVKAALNEAGYPTITKTY